jgi:hypothetical protein
MSKRDSKKTVVVKLNLKPFWEVSKGHMDHLSGSGTHDHRPKRERTRGASNRKAIREYD